MPQTDQHAGFVEPFRTSTTPCCATRSTAALTQGGCTAAPQGHLAQLVAFSSIKDPRGPRSALVPRWAGRRSSECVRTSQTLAFLADCGQKTRVCPPRSREFVRVGQRGAQTLTRAAHQSLDKFNPGNTLDLRQPEHVRLNRQESMRRRPSVACGKRQSGLPEHPGGYDWSTRHRRNSSSRSWAALSPTPVWRALSTSLAPTTPRPALDFCVC